MTAAVWVLVSWMSYPGGVSWKTVAAYGAQPACEKAAAEMTRAHAGHDDSKFECRFIPFKG